MNAVREGCIASAALAEGLLEAVPAGIAVVDSADKIVLVNRKLEAHLGYEREEFFGMPVEALFRSSEMKSETTPGHRRLTVRRKDGSEFVASVTFHSIHAVEGHFVLAVFADDAAGDWVAGRQGAEELRLAVERSYRASEDLEQFVYVASHDLQEPLRIISSFVELLANRYRDQLDEKAHRWIDFVVDGAGRMKQLINELLQYSRVDTQGKPLEETDCGQVFQAAIVTLHQEMQETGATVTSGALPTVLADRSQLTQVFRNLLGNAVKFRGGRQPEIHVDAVRSENTWQFSVRDNGIGIDKQFAERIFVIFQRLHTRKEYQGTGIGLALCKKIVERHGGRIWVESELGHGATFFFTLPVPGASNDPQDFQQAAT